MIPPPFQGRGKGWVTEPARCRRRRTQAPRRHRAASVLTHPYEQGAIPPGEWLRMSGGHPHLLIPSLERDGKSQKPTSSRLSNVAFPPELVVSVLVTRSVQKRGR